jgi:hypothetical protein
MKEINKNWPDGREKSKGRIEFEKGMLEAHDDLVGDDQIDKKKVLKLKILKFTKLMKKKVFQKNYAILIKIINLKKF